MTVQVVDWDSVRLAVKEILTPPTSSETKAERKIFRDQFLNVVRNYLRDHHFPYEVSKSLLSEIFRSASRYKNGVQALPKMQDLVKSPDWRGRAVLLRVLAMKQIPTWKQDLKQRLNKGKPQGARPLTRRSAVWVLGQLDELQRKLRAAYSLQKAQADIVREYKHPPLGSQFLLEVRQMVMGKKPKWKVDDVHLLVAACGLAAGVFTAKDEASDIVSRIPMRISRADKTMSERAKRDWTNSPEAQDEAELEFLNNLLQGDLPPKIPPMPEELREPQEPTGTLSKGKRKKPKFSQSK